MSAAQIAQNRIQELEQQLRETQIAVEGLQAKLTDETARRITADYENGKRKETISGLLAKGARWHKAYVKLTNSGEFYDNGDGGFVADNALMREFDAIADDVQSKAHSDDIAVDAFAGQMKEKLAAARLKGRSGWDDPARCSVDYLAELLAGHLTKNNQGNWLDIANFSMMLHTRGADPATLAPPMANIQVRAVESLLSDLRRDTADTNPARHIFQRIQLRIDTLRAGGFRPITNPPENSSQLVIGDSNKQG